MKLQTGATQVATRTAKLMQAKRVGKWNSDVPAIQEPIWFRSVLTHAPTHDLLPKVRNLDAQPKHQTSESKFFATRTPRKFSTNPKHLYRLKTLKFKEDKIRSLFYSTHPWELARPRSMIEQDGETSTNRDWSTMEQPGLALSGESVVQRTLYLSELPEYKNNTHDAYSKAVSEFVHLRIRQHAECEVAAEEAMLFGAVIDQSALQYGFEREQKIVDEYAVEALEASKALEGKQVSRNSQPKEEAAHPTFDDEESK